MKRIALLLAFAGLSLSGCKNDTYCLNCQSADGSPADFMPPDDLTEPPDLVPPPDLLPPPDLTVIGPDGGPCVPTNAGIEKCDGLDNDCNGIVDDVAASKLAIDPENCGKCGSACDYTATHQTGVCAGGTCSPGTCLPGYIDNNPGIPGCEYACTPTVPATEVCDGKDNDCNGTTDDGFGYPKYNLGAANCGACGNVCNLPGAVSYCATDPTTGSGVCAVDHCVNNGTNTYRHSGGAPGVLNTAGCEYHCPFPSTTVTSGSHDCDDTTCSFPAEVCNGIDDDCNRINDDNPNDVGVAFACGSACPMGDVTKCVGECKAGSLTCVSGVKVCQGSVGPTVELCDLKDNDCNGMTDESPQDSWVNQACCPTGKTSDCQNTGTGSRCSTGVYQCQLGLKACSGGVSKTPEVCNASDDDCNGTTDDVPGVGSSCTGGGTNTAGSCTAAYSCNGGVPGPGPSQLTCKQVIGPKPETCNLLDDDCDGNTDNGNPGGGVACGQNCPGGTTGGCVGACMAGTTVCSSGAIVCQNSTGPAAETCDSKDNDCNGSTDDVPGIGSACSNVAGGIFNTGRCVAKLQCTGAPGPGVNGLTCTQIIGPLAHELCNGIDDNCNGTTDEAIIDPAVGVACGQNCPGGTVAGCKGTCMPGTSQCSNGAVICVGSTGPAQEICDGKDNNCDGLTDNAVADPWVGQGCCPTGVASDCQNAGGSTHCVMGSFTCTGGAKVCNGGVAKGVEVCDGIDNDCNGVIDDVPGIGQACTGGGTNTTGRCTAAWACTGVAGPGPSGLTCQQAIGPAPTETCNGIDDNCNGTTDEGNPGAGAACGKNCPGGLVANCRGACVAGTTACTNGAIVCNGSTGPTTEVCNNIDDNCDGTTDNAITDPWAGQACCSTGNNADCTNTGTGTRCKTAMYTCVAGARTCAGSVAKSSEVCDNVDNDCNGPVDDVSGVNSPCTGGGTNTAGKCTARYTCNGGVPGPGPNQLTCTQLVGPTAELCNGIDDDCNGTTDDNATDVGAAFPCYQQCPGGVPAGCKGECHAGQLACSSGVKTCSTPPGVIGAETCDGKDNDCNGTTDDGFGFPLYNTDPTHCGTCATSCNLLHAVNGCHSDATIDATNKGVCFVVACANTPAQGYSYVPSTCGGNTPTRDGPAGVGCNYTCPVWPTTGEVCDGKDNDCNGATDELKTACYTNGLVAPSICSNKGVCMGQVIPVNCQGAAGWKCNYAGVPNIDLVAGNLAPAENNGAFCDGLDNNCNGQSDIDGFPNKGGACTAGIGVCQNPGTFVCNSPTNTALVCSASASPNNAVDELCDGKDNNCDGNTDERTPTGTPTCFNGGSHPCLGYKDPMVQIGATGKYVYAFEASRPGATNLSPGGDQSRACSVSGVLPWATVTETQAAAACAAVKDSLGNPMRLCDATEWQQACEGPGGAAASKWSESTAPTTYVSGVCNDVNRANPDAVWATATTGPAGAPLCYTDWAAAGKVYDMSGNVEEWTKTTVVSGGTTYFKIRGGSYTSPQGGTTCEFDFNIAQSTFANSDVGFRCCSDAAP